MQNTWSVMKYGGMKGKEKREFRVLTSVTGHHCIYCADYIVIVFNYITFLLFLGWQTGLSRHEKIYEKAPFVRGLWHFPHFGFLWFNLVLFICMFIIFENVFGMAVAQHWYTNTGTFYWLYFQCIHPLLAWLLCCVLFGVHKMFVFCIKWSWDVGVLLRNTNSVTMRRTCSDRHAGLTVINIVGFLKKKNYSVANYRLTEVSEIKTKIKCSLVRDFCLFSCCLPQKKSTFYSRCEDIFGKRTFWIVLLISK